LLRSQWTSGNFIFGFAETIPGLLFENFARFVHPGIPRYDKGKSIAGDWSFEVLGLGSIAVFTTAKQTRGKHRLIFLPIFSLHLLESTGWVIALFGRRYRKRL
jgi:hypothetical protein